MPFKALLLLLFSVYPIALQAQHPDVNVLTADSMHGRGYVMEGMQKAADYVASAFEELGLLPLPETKGYFQYFSHPVNTFPGEVSLSINGNLLQPGADYLADPASPSIAGRYVLHTTKGMPPTDNSLIVIRDTFASTERYNRILEEIRNYCALENTPGAGAILVTQRKLTWSVATEQYAKPLLIIKENAWIDRAENIDIRVEARFVSDFRAANVMAIARGTQQDSTVIIGAHYDHLGRMGRKTLFPGANDNASGTAMLLDLARYFSVHRPRYNMVFVAFASEEAGLIGSRFFTENPPTPLEQVRLMINLDLTGTGQEGITVVNGSILHGIFDELQSLNERRELLPVIKPRGEACNSDHCPFYNKGVPAIFIYTMGGIKAYHDIYDRAETLPLTEFINLKRLLIEYISSL
ncbi:M28 family metallopeptidase [Roseivirga sp. BDSF3-8]|uniref:M28 family metallopeptidase n=1 Tax=Roseivirga sp. BDSF3-8 TaxID=3241598 RepID=UPI003531FDC8